MNKLIKMNPGIAFHYTTDFDFGFVGKKAFIND